jgi:WD40 repeat protein
MLVSGGADKVLNFWGHHKLAPGDHVEQPSCSITALAWTTDGKSLTTVCEDGIPRRFTEFKTHSGEQSGGGASERPFDKAGDILYCLTTTEDGKIVFAGCYDGLVYVWNAEGKVKAKLSLPEGKLAHTTKPHEAATHEK